MARRDETRRRDFLRSCVAGAFLLGGARSSSGGHSGAAGSCRGTPWGTLGGARPTPTGTNPVRNKSKVIIARDPMLRGAGRSVDSGRLLKLLDKALQSYYDCDSAVEAWRKVVRPGDTVGLKVNCLAGRGISTTVPVVEAVCERLQQAGIRDIVIWDRLNSDLESAGFRVGSRNGIRCLGNDSAGYEEQLAVYGSVGLCCLRL